MAQYRLSVNIIGRSAGRSATGAAAYRSGSNIKDELTGDVHNYTRKDGVLHTEILAPENAPEWMLERSQLWNGVERVERRRDAQLAREIQLSLPHELSLKQQQNLVRNFIQEQHVSKGMVADIAIHAPSSDPAADERNVHAHVMLTMRELLGDGFGKKAREWNAPEMLEGWRQAWSDHQNREFERLGLSVRVDHRSLEDQGIMREPQKHLGPIATEIERDGRASYRGDENREIEKRNGLYADIERHSNMVDARILFEQRKFAAWSDKKFEDFQLQQQERDEAFQARIDEQMAEFEASLDAELGQTKEGLTRSHEQVSDRLDVRGWRKFIRDITGITRRDRTELEGLEAEQRRIQEQEQKKRAIQEQNVERARNLRATEELSKAQHLEKAIQKAEQRREADGWKMGAGKGVKAHQELSMAQEQDNAPPAPPDDTEEAPTTRQPVSLRKEEDCPRHDLSMSQVKQQAQKRLIAENENMKQGHEDPEQDI